MFHPRILLRLRQANYCTNTHKRLIQSNTCRRLVGKVAIVTASTQGIGFAVAERFCSEGAHVVVSSRCPENVNEAVEKLKGKGHSVLGLTCHVSKKEDRKNLIQKTIQEFGGIDILVSNAATNPFMGGILQCSESAWDKIFEVNVKNSLQLTQEIVPHMKERKGGSIVYVSSIVAVNQHIYPEIHAYSVSKTALLAIMKTVALEVVSENIRVNSISPGGVDTKFIASALAMESMYKSLMANTPMKRLAEAHEIAGTVAFLCSDDASYITGENIVIAGGVISRI